METVAVVTAFLRNRGEVLLLRRSDAVGSYPGQWGGVAGHAERETRPERASRNGERRSREPDPDALVREEIREETGLDEHVTLVRRGEPFEVEDAERGTRWRVHPYLFDCDSREVTPNEETTEYEWVPATAIRERDTVPELWTSYDRVRPRIEDVAADTTHGSATLSVRALEVLRDEAALAADWDRVAEVARDLCTARPAMHAVVNRVNRAMTDADARTPEGVVRAAIETIERAASADAAAAAAAADRLQGMRILTLSRSGTVTETLRRADPDAVFVLESRPGGEGVDVAASLAADLDGAVTVAPDATVAHLLSTEHVDALLVGVDSVLPYGAVVNKVGTRTAATVAAHEDCAVLAVCARAKIAPAGTTTADLEPRDPAELYDGDADLRVVNPTFDRTPPALVDALVTDAGTLDPDAVGSVADEHAALAEWQS
ncbi:NUDIX domain-containing protein [Halorarius litoreus]|uniref:NUDIX domain-containing protein n=1 Tax=Halorarius litoreus TaxID=2962676 RepID=UPI0020CF42B3|nr:NUDIX domain-containing protein [Halorarius litoreus]